MSSLKSKLEKNNFSFTKNFVKAIIFPVIVLVLALVLTIAVGFNKGMDFKGGVIASVMSQTTDFEDFGGYNKAKADIDSVLTKNKVGGSVYTVETDSATYNKVLVVKIAYNGNEEQEETLVNNLKDDLVAKFYPEVEESELENRHLVVVSTFEGQVSSWTVVSSVLATLIAVLAICIYMGFRMGLFSAVLGVIASVYNCLFAFALIMATRVQFNTFTLAVLPFVAIMTLIYVFLFVRRAKRLEKTSEKYTKLSNYKLADDAVMHGFNKQLYITCFALASLVLLGIFNIASPVVFLCLAFVEAIVAVVYTNLFITPALFALTYVRKFKKVKDVAKNNDLVENN